MEAKEKKKLKKFINELAQIRGRHTELVSVYVPQGYNLDKIIGHLQEEQGTAKNIKDAKTRGNVIDSLEKVIRHLRLFKRTPEHGIAVFAGNVAAKEGKVDIKVWSIEPPQPLNTRLYRCDQIFVLDIIRGMLEEKETYGLVVMDRREATIGFLKGTNIKTTAHLTSGVPGKIKAGGQSAARYERIREGMAKEFYKRIADAVQQEFLGNKHLKGILLGGPGPTKEEFQPYINTQLRNKIIAVQDLSYTDESGLHHLVEKSQDVLTNVAIADEKKVMQKFFTLLNKEASKAAYGKQEVEQALAMGAVDVLLLSDDLDDHTLEALEEKAEQTKTTVHLISTDTNEGQQLKDLGGIAAILRFPIQ